MRKDVLERLRELGFEESDASVLADHFLDAEARGKEGHGLTRVDWLATLTDLNPEARPERVHAEPGFERWDGRGALGYLTLAAICRCAARAAAGARACDRRGALLSDRDARLLGAEARRRGLVAALTATSPARLPHPEGGEPLAGTNPLAIAIPSSDGQPIVADVSMGKVTYGDVLAGKASEDELVPFGGEQSHKAFALAIGLQLLVDALAGDGYGAVMVVAQAGGRPGPGSTCSREWCPAAR